MILVLQLSLLRTKGKKFSIFFFISSLTKTNHLGFSNESIIFCIVLTHNAGEIETKAYMRVWQGEY